MMVEKRHLILIGFMGTGKTTVGKALAPILELPWVDTDQSLVEQWGFSIAEYFQCYGEASFREAETAKLKELLQSTPSVITTGGGIVLKRENQDLMKKYGWVIHLHADPEEIIRRVRNDLERPLLKGDTRQKVLQLYEERTGKYDFADLTIDTTMRPIEEIVEQIHLFWNKKQV